MGFDIHQVRHDFPILDRSVYDKPLVYLDNGATTQKPRVVIDRLTELQEEHNSSIHRGIHYLSEQMTERYEAARESVRSFLNASSSREIVFTSGATGSINAVATSFGEEHVKAGDEVLITEMEHHSNIVPWQMLCRRKGATLKVLPIDDEGQLRMDLLGSFLTGKTRIMAVTHASNSLGTINPVGEIVRECHGHDIPVLVDGAQMVQHGEVDVQEIGCDFYVFSSHKIFGPTGTGVLYGKESWLESLPPYQGGGDMVDQVTFEETTYNELPFKFEAGTSNYLGAIGLATAIEYVKQLGMEGIRHHEAGLIRHARERLEAIPGLTLYGRSDHRISVFSFLMEGVHAYDAGMILDKLGIAVRTGTHCTQPVMDHFGIPGTIRASMVFYNTVEEIDILAKGIQRTAKMFAA